MLGKSVRTVRATQPTRTRSVSHSSASFSSRAEWTKKPNFSSNARLTHQTRPSNAFNYRTHLKNTNFYKSHTSNFAHLHDIITRSYCTEGGGDASASKPPTTEATTEKESTTEKEATTQKEATTTTEKTEKQKLTKEEKAKLKAEKEQEKARLKEEKEKEKARLKEEKEKLKAEKEKLKAEKASAKAEKKKETKEGEEEEEGGEEEDKADKEPSGGIKSIMNRIKRLSERAVPLVQAGDTAEVKDLARVVVDLHRLIEYLLKRCNKEPDKWKHLAIPMIGLSNKLCLQGLGMSPEKVMEAIDSAFTQRVTKEPGEVEDEVDEDGKKKKKSKKKKEEVETPEHLKRVETFLIHYCSSQMFMAHIEKYEDKFDRAIERAKEALSLFDLAKRAKVMNHTKLIEDSAILTQQFKSVQDVGGD